MEIPSAPGEHVSGTATFAMLTAVIKLFQKFRTGKVNGAFRKVRIKLKKWNYGTGEICVRMSLTSLKDLPL